LHVDRRLPSWRQPPGPARLVEEQLRRDMMQVAGDLTAVVERGAPAEVIVRIAADRGCELIVTGIARDETLGRFGLGTTVDRLVRRARIPVLVVKQRARASYHNIVVATDFSESARHALRAAMRFFPDRSLSLFHAYEPPFTGIMGDSPRYAEEHRELVRGECARFLKEMDIPAKRRRALKLLAERGEPAYLLQDFARHERIDLVVLGTHGRSAMFDMVIGSTARAILSCLPCDALVVREQRAAVEGGPVTASSAGAGRADR